MSGKASEFLRRVKDAAKLTDGGRIDFFVYFLTVEEKQPSANATAIANCFIECDLTPPARIAPYLSEGLTSNPQRFVKAERGYKLHRNFREMLAAHFGNNREKLQVGNELRKLEGQLPSAAENEFLKETIDCLRLELWGFSSYPVLAFRLIMGDADATSWQCAGPEPKDNGGLIARRLYSVSTGSQPSRG